MAMWETQSGKIMNTRDPLEIRIYFYVTSISFSGQKERLAKRLVSEHGDVLQHAEPVGVRKNKA